MRRARPSRSLQSSRACAERWDIRWRDASASAPARCTCSPAAGEDAARVGSARRASPRKLERTGAARAESSSAKRRYRARARRSAEQNECDGRVARSTTSYRTHRRTPAASTPRSSAGRRARSDCMPPTRARETSKHCRVVTVVGEAGIGKTRLTRELVAHRSETKRRCSSAAACPTERARRTCRSPRSSQAGTRTVARGNPQSCSKARTMRSRSPNASRS